MNFDLFLMYRFDRRIGKHLHTYGDVGTRNSIFFGDTRTGLTWRTKLPYKDIRDNTSIVDTVVHFPLFLYS